MQGYNEMRINPATMQQIVQEWIERNLKGNHVVTNVSVDKNATNGDKFIVKIDSEWEEENGKSTD